MVSPLASPTSSLPRVLFFCFRILFSVCRILFSVCLGSSPCSSLLRACPLSHFALSRARRISRVTFLFPMYTTFSINVIALGVHAESINTLLMYLCLVLRPEDVLPVFFQASLLDAAEPQPICEVIRACEQPHVPITPVSIRVVLERLKRACWLNLVGKVDICATPHARIDRPVCTSSRIFIAGLSIRGYGGGAESSDFFKIHP